MRASAGLLARLLVVVTPALAQHGCSGDFESTLCYTPGARAGFESPATPELPCVPADKAEPYLGGQVCRIESVDEGPKLVNGRCCYEVTQPASNRNCAVGRPFLVGEAARTARLTGGTTWA
jgi:hypothetical protein